MKLLDFAASGRYEAWPGNLGFIVDASYVNLKADRALGGGIVDVDIRQKWLEFLVGYKVADGTYGTNNHMNAVDLQAGARVVSDRCESVSARAVTLPNMTHKVDATRQERWRD